MVQYIVPLQINFTYIYIEVMFNIFNMIICTKHLYKVLFMKQVWFAADLLTLTQFVSCCYLYCICNCIIFQTSSNFLFFLYFLYLPLFLINHNAICYLAIILCTWHTSFMLYLDWIIILTYIVLFFYCNCIHFVP